MVSDKIKSGSSVLGKRKMQQYIMLTKDTPNETQINALFVFFHSDHVARKDKMFIR